MSERGDQVTGSKIPKRHSPEFKDKAAKMVVDPSRPIAQVARELGVNRATLGFWVKAYRQQHSGDELPIDMPHRPDEAADITGQELGEPVLAHPVVLVELLSMQSRW
jgi:transposase-like protein